MPGGLDRLDPVDHLGRNLLNTGWLLNPAGGGAKPEVTANVLQLTSARPLFRSTCPGGACAKFAANLELNSTRQPMQNPCHQEINRHRSGFSTAEPNESAAYVKLNRQTPCPPRSAVSVNPECHIGAEASAVLISEEDFRSILSKFSGVRWPDSPGNKPELLTWKDWRLKLRKAIEKELGK